MPTPPLRCEDLGPDRKYPSRHVGYCMVDAIDLHRWLVRNGWALNSEPYAHGRFKAVIAHTRARHARDRTAVEQMILRQLEE